MKMNMLHAPKQTQYGSDHSLKCVFLLWIINVVNLQALTQVQFTRGVLVLHTHTHKEE
eukprot:m.72362 g.72362  ORF g.72362 m.72362 type:complete len:58 (+) comp11735_c1_seq20:1716-1889(+)